MILFDWKISILIAEVKNMINTIGMWVADIVPFVATVVAFAYGVKNFFKKGKAFYLQIVTMAMGCYAMGSFYHLCQALTSDEVVDGFTAAYLGKIGFFLFLYTANYGQIDGLMDDGAPELKKTRRLALLAPLAVALLYIPCALTEMPVSTKITYALVWIAAMLSSYYNFKHAIISDFGYGFAKAIRPYNISATALIFIELLVHVLWCNYDIAYGFVWIAIASVIFGVTSVITMVKLRKGVEAWFN